MHGRVSAPRSVGFEDTQGFFGSHVAFANGHRFAKFEAGRGKSVRITESSHGDVFGGLFRHSRQPIQLRYGVSYAVDRIERDRSIQNSLGQRRDCLCLRRGNPDAFQIRFRQTIWLWKQVRDAGYGDVNWVAERLDELIDPAFSRRFRKILAKNG
jgi:hypothetical protein